MSKSPACGVSAATLAVEGARVASDEISRGAAQMRTCANCGSARRGSRNGEQRENKRARDVRRARHRCLIRKAAAACADTYGLGSNFVVDSAGAEALGRAWTAQTLA